MYLLRQPVDRIHRPCDRLVHGFSTSPGGDARVRVLQLLRQVVHQELALRQVRAERVARWRVHGVAGNHRRRFGKPAPRGVTRAQSLRRFSGVFESTDLNDVSLSGLETNGRRVPFGSAQSVERRQTNVGVDRSSRLRTCHSETLGKRRSASISRGGDVARRRTTRVTTGITSRRRVFTRGLCSGIDVVATQAGRARGCALRLRDAAARASARTDKFIRALFRRDAKGFRERRARRRRASLAERCGISRASSLSWARKSARIRVRGGGRNRGRRRVGHQWPPE